MPLADRLEFAAQHDPCRNYCLWDYAAPAPPEGKLRAVTLLLHSFQAAGIDPRAYAAVAAIRDGIGPFRTVFGIKLAAGRLAWELYFYDYRRQRREVSLPRVLDLLRPYMPCPAPDCESLPYFMFSLALSDAALAGRRPLDVVRIYVGNPGSALSSGIAYAMRAGAATLENFYFFFDAATQMGEVAAKVASSGVFDASQAPIDAVLLPELRRCQSICVANKQAHDCIYFSGVDVGQLLWFLERFEYPRELVAFIEANRARLDHLLYDVGFDYRTQGGELHVLKSGYYGVF